VRDVTNPPHPRTGPMCIVDCPLCDRPVPFEPGDETFACPGCTTVVAVVDPEPELVLLAAA